MVVEVELVKRILLSQKCQWDVYTITLNLVLIN